MKTICFTNNKGGVGKSTSAVSVATYFAMYENLKVLVIDLDPQGNTTSNFVDKAKLSKSKTTYDVFKNKEIKDCIMQTRIKNLDIVPTNLELDKANVELFSAFSRENILKKCLVEIKNEYDICVIDTAPTLSVLTFNGLVASDSVYIPVRAGGYELDGIKNLIKTIKEIQQIPGNNTKISGVFFTHYENTNVSKASKNEIEKKIMPTMKSNIRRNVSLSEVPLGRTTIFEYEPKSNGALDYIDLSKEIMEIDGIKSKK